MKFSLKIIKEKFDWTSNKNPQMPAKDELMSSAIEAYN